MNPLSDAIKAGEFALSEMNKGVFDGCYPISRDHLQQLVNAARENEEFRRTENLKREQNKAQIEEIASQLTLIKQMAEALTSIKNVLETLVVGYFENLL